MKRKKYPSRNFRSKLVIHPIKHRKYIAQFRKQWNRLYNKPNVVKDNVKKGYAT